MTKKALIDKLKVLFIKFNTSPHEYQKRDYYLLLQILGGLIDNLELITDWDNVSDETIPSSKLVKDTLQQLNDSKESLINKVSTFSQNPDDIHYPSEKLVSDSLNTAYSQIRKEVNDRVSEILRVEGLISSEKTARELADYNLQNTKQDNLTPGSNISIVNNIISAVDTIYDDTEVKQDISNLEQNKQNNLTAGDNISINGTTISAVDTTYKASDFDIKDLSDSTNLRQTWSGKQDELTAGENIQINGTTISATDTIYDDTEVKGLIDTVDQKVENLDEFTCGTIVSTTTNFVEGTDYTVHEALQRTANLFEGYQGEIDDINALIPNQTTTSNQLADKAFVNDTVATNAANFRGSWTNFTAVPTSVNDYPADYSGSKTPTNNDYLVVQDGTDYDPSNTGMWRFIYVGDWNIAGKSGWTPQYRVGSAFTQAQQDAIDSGITSTKVGTYDGYATSIGALQTDKLDKVYTADKVYGTNNQGSQIAYTAGNNISFTNGQISATESDPYFMNQGASIEAIESENLDDITVIVEGRDTLTPNQLTQVEGILTNRFWFGTQAEYDAIQTKVPTTIYFIEKT